MIKNILFDCWSTLIKFDPKTSNWPYVALLDNIENKDEIDVEEFKKFATSFLDEYYNPSIKYEIDNIQFYQLLVDTFNLKLNKPLEEIKEMTLDYLNIRSEDDVLPFLYKLKERKLNLAIASNTMYSKKKTQEIIKSTIDVEFDDIITSSMYGVRKPHKEFFIASLNRLGYKKDETIYIGDSPIEDGYGPYLAAFKGSILVLNTNKNPSLITDRRIYEDKNYLFRIYQNYKELLSDFDNLVKLF